MTANESIRLLRLLPSALKSSPLRCELQHASLQAEPPPVYDALSYVWGSSNFTETILVDGHECSITKSLDGALRRLRQRWQSRVMWVDQICVNQDDMDERSSQVLLFGKLYRTAKRVVAWLGASPAREYEEGMGWLRHWLVGLKENVPFTELYLSAPSWSLGAIKRKITFGVGRSVPMEKLRLHMTARELRVLERVHGYIAAFDEIPYWSRMWILQEFILARQAPTLLLGEGLVFDDDFLQAALWARRRGGVLRLMADARQRAYEGLERYDAEAAQETQDIVDRLEELGAPEVGFVKHLKAREQIKDDQWKLSMFLKDTYELQSGDPRDKVYALYAMVPDHYDLPKPDYTAPVDKVLRDVMACIIAVEKSPKVYDWIAPSPPESSWPSWTPNFAAPDNSRNHEKYNIMRSVNFVPEGAKASGITTSETPQVDDAHACLTLQGWRVDEIGTVFQLPEPHGIEQVLNSAWRCAKLARDIVGRDEHDDTLQTKPSKLMSFLDMVMEVTATLNPSENESTSNAVSDVNDQSKSLMTLMSECMLSRETSEELRKKVNSAQFRAMDLEDSTLFCTTQGYIGFVYEKHGVQPGDMALIIAGCDFPYILRKHGDGWLMIGSAFVSGIMEGDYFKMQHEDDVMDSLESFRVV